MKQYWHNLSSREQLIVLAGGVLIIAVLYFFILIDPALQSTKTAKQQIHQQSISLAWMKSTQQEVRQLKNNASPAADRSQSILVTVDRAARRLQLKPALKRLEPEGEHKVRLWFENAAFAQLTQLFAQLQQKNGIHVQSISLNRSEQSGYVDAKIVLSDTTTAP